MADNCSSASLSNSGLLKVIGTGSSGNCLAVYDSSGQYILLDVGVPMKTILKGVDYNTHDCVAAFVSHVHKDHAKAIDDCIKYAIPVYANDDVRKKYPKCNIADGYNVGNFSGFQVHTFGVAHDVQNNAFVIDTIDGIRILYATDMSSVQWCSKDVNYAVIECNYSEEDLIDNIIEDEESRSKYYNHFELNKCIHYLKNAVYNTELQGIILWHMSKSNIDAKKAVEKVKFELGFQNVYAANSGDVYQMIKTEF